MDWLDFVAGVAVGMVGTDVLRLLVYRFVRRQKPDQLPEFKATEPYDPDAPKGSAARISRINFTRRTDMRRPVRRYDIWEDGADPFRDQ